MTDNTTPTGRGYAAPGLITHLAGFAERLEAELRGPLDGVTAEDRDPVDCLMAATKYATKVYATDEAMGYATPFQPMTDEERAAYRAEREAERARYRGLSDRLREAAAGDPGAAAVVELHAPAFDDYSGTPDCGWCEVDDYGPEAWPCATVEAMAAAYGISTEDYQ